MLNRHIQIVTDLRLNLNSLNQFVIDFFKYALVGMVLEWIRRDMKTEPAIMAERFNTMMQGDLKRALLRFSTDGRASKIDD